MLNIHKLNLNFDLHIFMYTFINMIQDQFIKSFFKKIVVLDLSSVLAGPQVGSFFSELGAEVIKIENKNSQGDPTRQWKLEVEDQNSSISSYYASANYKKSTLLLDLTHWEDYEKMKQFAMRADIVVSNALPKVSTKLKIDYDTLKNLNPKIIYAQLVAYGADDDRPGYDLVMQAEAGFMAMNGSQNGKPAKMPVAIIDLMAAHQMKEAILIAMLKRAETSQGSLIQVSLYQSAIASLANQASNFLMCGHIPQKMGSLHPNIAPYGEVMTSSDGVEFILAVGSDEQYRKLGKTLNSVVLQSDIFISNQQRVKQRISLLGHLESAFQKLPYEEISIQLKSQQIPFCRVNRLDEVFDNELAKEMIISQKLDDIEARSVSQIAFKIN